MRAKPKSASFNSPRSLISRFCGLKNKMDQYRLMYEQTMRLLQIAVKDFLRMTIVQTAQKLKQKQANVLDIENICTIVHILFQILLHVLKHQCQGRLIEYNVVQADDVVVFEAFQQAHFA
jgi:hypothetical protein